MVMVNYPLKKIKLSHWSINLMSEEYVGKPVVGVEVALKNGIMILVRHYSYVSVYVLVLLRRKFCLGKRTKQQQ